MKALKDLLKKSIPEPDNHSKKVLWEFIIQTIISILTAVLTVLGVSSCVHHMM